MKETNHFMETPHDELDTPILSKSYQIPGQVASSAHVSKRPSVSESPRRARRWTKTGRIGEIRLDSNGFIMENPSKMDDQQFVQV